MMRTLAIILVMTFASGFSHRAVAQDASEKAAAKKYLTHYFDLLLPIQKDMWKMSVGFSLEKQDDVVKKKRDELILTLKRQKKIAKSGPNFGNDSLLRLQAVSWMILALRVIQTDYIYLREMRAKAQASPQDMRDYLKYKEKLNLSLQRGTAQFDGVAHNFAKKHGLMIFEDESKISTRLKRANEVVNYYDKVYLSFFDAFYLDARFNEAVNSSDPKRIKIAQMEILYQLQISRGELKIIGTYKDQTYEADSSLIVAAKNVFKVYSFAAREYGKTLLDFHDIQYEFDSVQTAIMSKAEKNRTTEEIKAYNELAKSYNAIVPKVNEQTEYVNAKRIEALAQWNDAVERFIVKNAFGE